MTLFQLVTWRVNSEGALFQLLTWRVNSESDSFPIANSKSEFWEWLFSNCQREEWILRRVQRGLYCCEEPEIYLEWIIWLKVYWMRCVLCIVIIKLSVFLFVFVFWKYFMSLCNFCNIVELLITIENVSTFLFYILHEVTLITLFITID